MQTLFMKVSNNMPRRLFVLQLLAALLLLAGVDTARAESSKPQDKTERGPKITRADLGWAYLRLEQAYFADPPTEGNRIATINEAFDTATLAFFGGQYAKTIQEIDELTASLLDVEPSVALAKAMSLKTIVEPPVVDLSDPKPIEIQMVPIYPVEELLDAPLRLQLRNAQGAIAVEIPLGEAGDDETALVDRVEIEPTSAGLEPGRYSIDVVVGDQQTVSIGRINVVPKSLDVVRKENEHKLDALDSTSELQDAIAVCRDRNALLNDRPSTTDSSQFLADTNQLVEEIASEIEMLSKGEDPYYRRGGDYWRTTSSDRPGKRVPLRVYAPEIATQENSVPLVVALHGAGGDENMFFEGYGAGRIKQLADEHGFLVASVSTNAFAAKAERFDLLLDELAADYNVDRSAVYVLGHSMGAGATSSIAGKRGAAIAAACCLAGGNRSTSESLPPTLMIAAELDKIIPAASLRSAAEKTIAKGLPLEFREMKNYGHTLMVGVALPDAVAWLLTHRATE